MDKLMEPIKLRNVPVVLGLTFLVVGCAGGGNPSATQAGQANSAGLSGSGKLAGTVTAPAGIVAAGAGNLVPTGGSRLVSQGAGNIVAAGAGNFASVSGERFGLMGATSKPLANTQVVLVDPLSLKEVERTTTDGNGMYQFTKAKPGLTYRVLAAGTENDKPVTLSTLASSNGKPADVSVASTCATIACLIKSSNQLSSVDSDKFSRLVESYAAQGDKDAPDLAHPEKMARWLGCNSTPEGTALLQDLVSKATTSFTDSLNKQLGGLGAALSGDLTSASAINGVAGAVADITKSVDELSKDLSAALGEDLPKALAEMSSCN